MSSPLSLEDLSQQVLVHRPQQLQCSLPYIPGKLHSQLFSTAALLVPTSKQFRQLRQSIQTLIINWPHELFSIRQLLPEKQCQALLHAGTNVTLFQIIIDSLLTLNSSCRMSVADFAGVHVPTLFQLPLFSLPPDLLNTDYILEEIREKCKDFYDIEESQEDNLEYVLPWKLQEIKEKHKKVEYEGRAPLKIFADCQINLTDWVSMIDEMSALILQRHTPFRMVITKLSVESFHSRETAHLRWFLSMLNPEDLKVFNIFGKRKSMSYFLWHVSDQLCRFYNLSSVTLSTTGPIMCYRMDGDPEDQALHQASINVFSSWKQLTEFYCSKIILTNKIRDYFGALATPLQCVNLYCARLAKDDLEYIAESHHIKSLVKMELAYNDFSQMADELCVMLLQATQLEVLSLKMSHLSYEQKVQVMLALAERQKIRTLCMYENEDMLSTLEYTHIISLACDIPSLTEFYIFPFNYKPFEMFVRPAVTESCRIITSQKNRTDLKLFY